MGMHPSSPYHNVPPSARWRETMAGRRPEAIDPHLQAGCVIRPTDKVASAGSCFAQRISEAIKDAGYQYMTMEAGLPFLSADEKKAMGYGVYSARYGNVYTSLQLLQLLRRALGRFDPQEPLWRNKDGQYVDPFRPAIQPGGFASESECLWDRQAHLKAVRQMFETVDVFIFTLGLTESWQSAIDGAVFPVCPGSGLGGDYDPERHIFHNFTVGEVVEHLRMFLAELAEVNPAARVILTVSPVPLMATFEPRHVLQSTVYSKSVLRVACEEIIRSHANVHYFGSYEIVTATGDSRTYLEEDLRSVSDKAVAHVIDCFRRWSMVDDALAVKKPSDGKAPATARPNGALMCDEDLIDAALAEETLNHG